MYDDIDRFWRYAKIKIIKQKISRELNLFLYLKELECRYNSQAEDVFELIIAKIASNSWVADYRGILG